MLCVHVEYSFAKSKTNKLLKNGFYISEFILKMIISVFGSIIIILSILFGSFESRGAFTYQRRLVDLC